MDPDDPGDAKKPQNDGSASGRTFVTSLKDTGPRSGRKEAAIAKRLVIETIPDAGPKLVGYRDELRQLADSLDVKVDDLLREHERDFFLAYKTHMYSVQKEFKNLKKKADDEEERTQSDLRIRSLERELEWFMTEALRLDELCKGYKREVDRWRTRATALDEDRRFLEDQTKGAKRQNKVLRAAVERAQFSAHSAMVATAGRPHTSSGVSRPNTQGRPPLADAHEALPPRPGTHLGQSSRFALQLPDVSSQPGSGRTRATSAGPKTPTSGAARERIDSQRSGRSLASAMDSDFHGSGGQHPSRPSSAAPISEVEQRYLSTISDLKSQIAKAQAQTKMVSAARAQSYTSKGALEEFFLKCVDEARKELARKKHVKANRPKTQQEKVLEVLLGSEDVLVFLYERLFPHRVGARQGRAGEHILGLGRDPDSGMVPSSFEAQVMASA
jgi:hypothetical protein